MTTDKSEPAESNTPDTGIKAPSKKKEDTESSHKPGSGMTNLLDKQSKETFSAAKQTVAESSIGKAVGQGLSGIAKRVTNTKEQAKEMALGALSKGANSVKQRVCAAKGKASRPSDAEEPAPDLGDTLRPK